MDNEELDIVEFILEDEKDGVFAISLVKEGAIQSSFQLFSNNLEKDKIVFEISDVDKQIITGPLLIPNKKILRKYSDTGEYYNAILSEKTISETAQKFFKNQNQNNATLDHKTKVKNNDITTYESWMVEDINNDKANALGFKDLVKGTWFVSMKVNSPELWKSIKEDDYYDFSIEAFFTDKTVSKFSKEDKKEDKNMYKKIIEGLENLTTLFKSEIKSKKVNFEDLILEDDSTITVDDTTMEVSKLDENGLKVIVSDGDYILKDGSTITVVDGKKVDLVEDNSATSGEATSTVSVVAEIEYLTLADGREIYIDDTNAVHLKEDASLLEDGDYLLLDGTGIKVVGGIWIENAESITPEEMEKVEENFAVIKTEFESLKVSFEEEKAKNLSLTEKVIELEKEIVELGKKPGAERTATHKETTVDESKLTVAKKILLAIDRNKELKK